jgi:hypothetical protein
MLRGLLIHKALLVEFEKKLKRLFNGFVLYQGQTLKMLIPDRLYLRNFLST